MASSSHSHYNSPTSSASNFNPNMFSGPGVRASNSSQSTRSSLGTSVNPLASSHMESTVTRLLVATKQLLESLTDWSQGRIDEGGVSDIYVRLGNEFNAASLAFSKEGIDMSDLSSVPDDLRGCLEGALSEEATPTTLDQHLPQIRQIVVHLLQGLKTKQAMWRAARRQHELELSQHSSSSSRPSSSKDFIVSDRTSVRTSSRTLSATKSREDLRRLAVASTSSGDYPRGPVSRVKPTEVMRRMNSAEQSTFDGSTASSSSKSRLSPISRTVRSATEIADRFRSNKMSPPLPPPPPPMPKQSGLPSASTPPPFGMPLPPVPASPQLEPINSSQASSLEALRKVDMLQRRASKRFSTYTYNKIASTASPHKRTDGQAGVGLGINVPALPRSPNTLPFLAREERSAAREASEAGRASAKAPGSPPTSTSAEDGRLQDEGSSLNANSRAEPSEYGKSPIPPIAEQSETSINFNPNTPNTSIQLNEPPLSPPLKKVTGSQTLPTPELPTVFLQLGKDIKKAKLESLPTIASLRVLFMDRFQYSPGSGDFPAIYIRDLQSGIQYQLEDMSEVKEKVVLSLNVDALDQVKAHIDSGLSSLAREMKELRSTVTSLRRQSMQPQPAPSVVNVLPASSTADSVLPAVLPAAPTCPLAGAHAQVSQLAQSGSQLFSPSATVSTRQMLGPKDGQQTSAVQSTEVRSLPDAGLQKLNGAFRNQVNEVQTLRRELGILKQLYRTFASETKSTFAVVRSQSEKVKQLAASKVSTSRSFIDSGKAKVESSSQDLVTKIESLQDTVEDIKQDVTNRKVRPKQTTMTSVTESIAAVGAELEEFTSYIAMVKPSWKKSWEDELQNIVDEQQLLNYQEDLVKDLKEDLVAVSSLFGHVKDYIDVRKASKSKPREFIPPMSLGALNVNPKDGLDSVMVQVKSIEPDVVGRLKAIEAAEKQREKNIKEVVNDEFAQELAGFVGNKKLRMTGGTEEIERMRNLRNEQALKAAFQLTSEPPTGTVEEELTSSTPSKTLNPEGSGGDGVKNEESAPVAVEEVVPPVEPTPDDEPTPQP